MTLYGRPEHRKRLAIVGAGSSGLITLYCTKKELVDWEIVVYERSNSVVGCWGRPYAGFVSTSTKFTTQFACYPVFDASVVRDQGASRSEFFREGEYGDYLESFADTFGLRQHIRFHSEVHSIEWDESAKLWRLKVSSDPSNSSQCNEETFDAVVLCTGLAAQPKEIGLDVPCLTASQLNQTSGLEQIQNCRVVVMGGGESAVDHACRLANHSLNNEVSLSLQSGIRVSPRYHPIRGVPSDFLRNRFMMSINEKMRNWIGQRFVEMRILYEERFRKWFPSSHASREQAKSAPDAVESRTIDRRKEWAYRLTKSAKDSLFNMFHNKSDDFLDLVAEDRIRIIGKPVDSSAREFYEFESTDRIVVAPDWVVPSIGYSSTIASISNGQIQIADCYMGCVSLRYPNLFLVGYARPIIGNIPSISEMQAAYVACLLSQRTFLPADVEYEHAEDRRRIRDRYSKLNLDAIYPVEMFPYCDELAKRMGCTPTLRTIGLLVDWLRLQCGPATTLQYFWSNPKCREAVKGLPIYMPSLLIGLLLMLKPIDWMLKGWWWLWRVAGRTHRQRESGTKLLS
jgi:dimethylaniline monooxygenase (N-oxide forming)